MDKGAAKAEGGTPAPRGVEHLRPTLLKNANRPMSICQWPICPLRVDEPG